jgi:hypothetical protein
MYRTANAFTSGYFFSNRIAKLSWVFFTGTAIPKGN